MKFSVHIFLLMVTVLENAKSWRSFELLFESVECAPKSEIAHFLNCSLSNLPKEQKGLCVYVQFSQKIKAPKLDISVEAIRWNKESFVLANVTRIDGCRFLESRGILNIIEIVRKEIEKFSNIPRKCPLAKDTVFAIKDLVVNPNNFPPYLPETPFIVNVRLWEDKVAVFELNLRGAIVSRNRNLQVPTNGVANKTTN